MKASCIIITKKRSVDHTMRLLLSLLFVSYASAFVLPASRLVGAPTTQLHHSTTPSQREDVEELKHEIEGLKAEALRRMQALKSELSEVGDSVVASSKPSVQEEVQQAAVVSIDSDKKKVDVEFTPQVAVSNAPRKEQTKITVQSQDETALLDDTRWKVMLNIGREPGAWSVIV